MNFNIFQRHGSQSNRTLEQLQYKESLKPVPRGEPPGCTDLSEGFDIVFDDLLDDILDQLQEVELSKLKLRHIVLGKNLFNKLDDDMDLRRRVQNHMAATNWKISVPLKKLNLSVSIWGEIFISIVTGTFEHPIFDEMPILRLMFRENTGYWYKIGKCKYPERQVNYFLHGDVVLVPYMLL